MVLVTLYLNLPGSADLGCEYVEFHSSCFWWDIEANIPRQPRKKRPINELSITDLSRKIDTLDWVQIDFQSPDFKGLWLKKKWRKQLPKIWIFLLKTEPYWSIRIKDKNKIRNSVKFIIKIIIRFECLIPLFFDMREKFYGFIWHIWTHILKYANYKSAQLSLTTFC